MFYNIKVAAFILPAPVIALFRQLFLLISKFTDFAMV